MERADSTASRKDFYSAYRKMALRYHPDKAGTSPEAADKFQLIQKAYETLSESCGENGARVLETMGPFAQFLDPKIIRAVNSFFFACSLAVAVLIIFPSFLSLRADGKVDWSWPVVFIPLFIFDAFLIWMAYVSAPEPTKDEDKPRREAGSQQRATNATDEDDDDEQGGMTKLQSRAIMVAGMLYFVCFALFHLLISLQLQGTITYIGIAFIPWFILEIAHTLMATAQTAAEIQLNVEIAKTRTSGELSEEELESLPSPKSLLVIIIENYDVIALRIAQAILIIIKVDVSSAASLDWRLVFLPAWLWGFFRLAGIIGKFITTRKDADSPQSQVQRTFLIQQFILFAITAVLFYSFIGLLVQRLNSDASSSDKSPAASVILIPVFILLSLLLCCCACCLPLLFSIFRSQLRDQFGDDSEGGDAQGNAERGAANDGASSNAAGSSTGAEPGSNSTNVVLTAPKLIGAPLQSSEASASSNTLN
eukprot:jgi/Hompol1/4534/HPOL_003693-RA